MGFPKLSPDEETCTHCGGAIQFGARMEFASLGEGRVASAHQVCNEKVDALRVWADLPGGAEIPGDALTILLAPGYITRQGPKEPWLLTRKGREALKAVPPS